VSGYGCSCQDGGSILDNIKVSSIVFSGTLLSVKEFDDYRGWVAYKIKIDKLFRGKVKSNVVIVWTPSGNTSCGLKLTSRKVLIYAQDAAFYQLKSYVKGFSFYTNVCLRSGSYSLFEEKGILQALKRI
jgi:ABC-type iron transport system FetAB ATPase subunit